MTATSIAQDRFQQPSRSRYRPEIDGIRAISILAVIANHFNKEFLPSGFLGVDIFFVISGYVITSSLFAHRTESLSHFLLGFYGRRIKRLVPALIVCVLLTSIAMSMVNPSPGVSLQTGIAALFGVSNLLLYHLSIDYFAPLTELNAFTHTWSLGVEEQFYFLFPLLFWFSGVTRRWVRAKRNLALMIGLLCLVSFIGFLAQSSSNPSAAYFLMPWRFWEMAAGVILYIVIDRYRLYRFSCHGLLTIVTLVLLFYVLTFPSDQRAFTTPLAVLLSSLLIAFLKHGQFIHKLLSWQPIVSIGLISYSLYLWHWTVLVISRYTTGIHPWTLPFQFGLILLFGLASYRFIETPLRRSPWSGSDKANLAIGLGSLISASTFLVFLGVSPGFSLYTGNKNSPKMVGQPSLGTPYLPNGAAGPGWKGDKCVLGSNADYAKIIKAEDCRLGNVIRPSRTILVIGDSFAPSFTSAFDDIVLKDRAEVVLVASYGASPVPEVPNANNQQKSNKHFWSEIVPRQIDLLKSGDIVLLISDLASFSPSIRDSSSDLKLSQYRDGLQRLSQELQSKGINLAVLSALPFAREAYCIPEVARREWFNAFGGPCHFLPKQKTLQRAAPLRTMLTELAEQNKLTVIDLMPVFCKDELCTYTNEEKGIVLYRDGNSHPSVEAARIAGDIFRREFNDIDRN